MDRADVDFESWLDRSFGRAVTGDYYPQFVHQDDEPAPVTDDLAVEYLTRLFENSEEALRHFSDRQISCGLWELGSGDAHCVYNRAISLDDRERLIGSVATFFRDFFDPRCIPKLAHLDREYTEPLNGICYMWWEVITWGWAADDADGKRLREADLAAMEKVLQLPNPACKESALHGLGHMAHRSDRAAAMIDRFLTDTDAEPELLQYARAARTGCIQ